MLFTCFVGTEPEVEVPDVEVHAFAVWVSVILGWLLPVSLVLILWFGFRRGGSRFRGVGRVRRTTAMPVLPVDSHTSGIKAGVKPVSADLVPVDILGACACIPCDLASFRYVCVLWKAQRDSNRPRVGVD
jgi:hypothetical protein